MKPENNDQSTNVTRRAFWASIIFYGLIAFEFFYMFSPFAAYIYSIYGPGLDVLNLTGSTSWLIGFFMPHIVRETQSLFITWHEVIGMTLLLGGFIAFLIGAAQIYWNKIKKRGAVFGGIYHYIRHPQYLALMISSFGMVLVWPRYLVLFGFVTVGFAYYFLAKIEENQCKQRFPDYDAYCQKTERFLPGGIEKLFKIVPSPTNKMVKIFSSFGLYVGILILSFAIAQNIHRYAVDNLYMHATDNDVYLSLGRVDSREIVDIADMVTSDSSVARSLAEIRKPDMRFINYMMPADLFVSEIPMHIPKGKVPTHERPGDKDQNRFKIIFSEAAFGPGESPMGKEILLQAINKSPVLEVWVNHNSRQVIKIITPPKDQYYEGMPVPVF